MAESIITRRQLIHATAATAAAGVLPARFAVAQASQPADAKGHHYRISCAAYSYRQYLLTEGKPGPETIFDFIKHCDAWGCDGVEPTSYYLTDTSTEYLNQLKREAFVRGLDLTGTAINNNFFHPAGEDRDREIAQVKAWIDRAVQMGAMVIRIFAGRFREGLERDKALAWAIEGLKEVSDYAGQRGVFLGLENHGFMTERAEDVLRLIDGANHPWLRANLDTGNFVEKPYENIAMLAPVAVNCQIKVEVRAEDGKAKIPADLPRKVRILRDAGYRGYLVLEYEAADDPRTAIPHWIKKLREAAEQTAG